MVYLRIRQTARVYPWLGVCPSEGGWFGYRNRIKAFCLDATYGKLTIHYLGRRIRIWKARVKGDGHTSSGPYRQSSNEKGHRRGAYQVTIALLEAASVTRLLRHRRSSSGVFDLLCTVLNTQCQQA